MDDLSEREIVSKDGAHVGEEVGSLNGVVGGQVTRVGVASVCVGGPDIQAIGLDVGRVVVSGSMGGRRHSAEAKEIQIVVEPVSDTGRKTRVLVRGSDHVVVDVGYMNLCSIIEQGGRWKALGGVGGGAG